MRQVSNDISALGACDSGQRTTHLQEVSKYLCFSTYHTQYKYKSMLKLIFLIYMETYEKYKFQRMNSQNSVLLTKHFSYSIYIFAFHVNSDIVH